MQHRTDERARGDAKVSRASWLVLASVCAMAACAGPPRPNAPGPTSARAALPDVRFVDGRPPVVLVAREGDPTSAVAVAVTTAGLAPSEAEEPELAAALAGIVEARVAARGLEAVVTPAWDGYRASILAPLDADARAAAEALRAALLAPVADADLPAAKRKLAALAGRPLRDAALARWAKCVGSPFAAPERVARLAEEPTAARLEALRRAAHGIGRVAMSVVGRASSTETAATTIVRGAAWPEARPAARAPARTAARLDATVYEASLEGTSPAEAHLTLDAPTASAAVTLADALGDPDGPLAARLATLEPPFRIREVAGTAHTARGCVGAVLEVASAPPRGVPAGSTLATRVADAVALVHAEARVHLGEGRSRFDGRVLARRAGDAREAAERAAWWGLVAPAATQPAPSDADLGGSVALAVSSRRSGSPRAAAAAKGEATLPDADGLAAAIERASAAWRAPVVEGRTRVERGHGEAWLLFGSPCGTEAEGEGDAGLAAVFALAAAEVARKNPDARVEPWVTADGVGLLVHGPPREGEVPAAHARRLADVVGRAFASAPLTPAALARARGEVVRRDVPAFHELASALAPRHPSWVAPLGREDTALRAADAAVVARAHALRAGPLRLAMLADVDAAQGDAALRAVDRWVARHGDGARACARGTSPAPPRPGTYAANARPGAMPEAWLAYPLPPSDDGARAAGTVVAAALDGDGGLLDRALGGPSPLARAWQARVVGWPRAPALAVRVVATEAALDGAVLQARALVDRVRAAGLPPAELERATGVASRAALAAALDPRARLVATFRGEPVHVPSSTRPPPSADELRAFATRHLAEDGMIVVAARPPRGRAP